MSEGKYRPYGKCYLPTTYCFRIISQKLPIPIPIGNCFGIDKVTVTDTQKLLIPIPIGNWLEFIKLPLPIPIPVRSHLPPLLAYSVSMLEFPKDVHNAPIILDFSQGFCAHCTKMLLSLQKRPMSKHPKNQMAERSCEPIERERWPLRSCMNRVLTQARSTTSNKELDRFP